MSSTKNFKDGGASQSVVTPDGDVEVRARTPGSRPKSVSRSGSLRDRSRSRIRAARSESEYGSADESAERSSSLGQEKSGEGDNFVVPAPVSDRAGPKCSKGRKRRGSEASTVSSNGGGGMEVDLTESDVSSKRPRDQDDNASTCSGSTTSSRGRPPTTGEYVGLAAAKADVNRMEQEELMLRAERELLDTWTGEPKITRARKALLGGEAPTDEVPGENLDPSSLSAADLAGQLQKSVKALYAIASFKKGYKGTSIKILREAAGVVSAVGTELLGRTQDDESRRLNDESRRLKEANNRLSGEVEELRKQLNELKGRVAAMAGPEEPVTPIPSTSGEPMEVTPTPLPQRIKRKIRGEERDSDCPPPSSPTLEGGGTKRGRSETAPAEGKEVEEMGPGMESLINTITGRMMARIEARFAVIEGRLPPDTLRPPLAADRGAATIKAKSFAEIAAAPRKKDGGKEKEKVSPVPSPPQQQNPPTKGGGMKGGGKKGGGKAADVTAPKVPPNPTPNTAGDNPAAGGSEWTTVDRRGKGKEREKAGPKKTSAPKKAQPPVGGAKAPKGGGKGGKAPTKRGQPAKPRKIRPPKQAAVLLSAEPPREGVGPVSLGDAIFGVRSSIKLADFGIASLRPRKAIGGGILYEIPGQESGERADKLAEALRALLEPKGVRVTRPVKLAELRVTGLDDSITPEEIRAAIAAAGGCPPGEVSVGKINRPPTGGLGSVWARCPAVAAKKVVEAGPLIVGWVRTRVEALGARPLQCYRCLGGGHSRANCKSEVDRSGLCYRCGQSGHRAAECSAEPKCPYCVSKGLKAEHRYGGPACASLRPERKAKKKGGKGAQKPPPPSGKAGDKRAASPTLKPPSNPEAEKGSVGGLEEAMETE